MTSCIPAKPAVLILLMVLVPSVTSCAMEPSLDDQAKIVEYEKCLSHTQMVQAKIIDLAIARNASGGEPVSVKEATFEASLEECEKFRP